MAAKKKAAVFILLGQSNAVGHALPMAEEDIIRTPLKNVYGLSREKNQSFTTEKLTWEHYTSSHMNLGETQDDTYSVANCLARQWQNLADSGKMPDLPDLYIVQIAIGAEGITQGYMWHPDYEKILIPGKLGAAKIALLPLTAHILSLLKKSFADMGTEIAGIRLHWRGGENDTTFPVEQDTDGFYALYDRIFDTFWTSLGEKCPTYLYKIFTEKRVQFRDGGSTARVGRVAIINGAFYHLNERNENVQIFDTSRYPGYNPEDECFGIFKNDFVHYTRAVNDWTAGEILKSYLK